MFKLFESPGGSMYSLNPTPRLATPSGTLAREEGTHARGQLLQVCNASTSPVHVSISTAAPVDPLPVPARPAWHLAPLLPLVSTPQTLSQAFGTSRVASHQS